MPIYDNISEWECDRCGEKHFAHAGDSYVKNWTQPTRYNSAGDKITAVLCPNCSAAYADLMEVHDKNFAEFLEGSN